MGSQDSTRNQLWNQVGKLIRKIINLFFLVTALFGSLLVASLLLIVWRISVTPLRLDFLTSYIQKTIVLDEDQYKLILGSTTLYWAGWGQPLDVRTTNLEIRTSAGQPVVLLPAISFSLSLEALSRGKIALQAIKVEESRLHIHRTVDGTLALGLEAQKARGAISTFDHATINTTTQLVENLFMLFYMTESLEQIQLTKGMVIFNDKTLGIVLTATDINIDLIRDHSGISANGRLFLQTAAKAVPIVLAGYRNIHGQQLSLALTFTNLRPADLQFPQLQVLANINLPVTGTLSVRLGRNLQVQDGEFLITGGSGVVIPFPQQPTVRYNVRSLTLQGTVGPGPYNIMLNRCILDLGGPYLELAAAVTWALPSDTAGVSVYVHREAGIPLVDTKDVALTGMTLFDSKRHKWWLSPSAIESYPYHTSSISRIKEIRKGRRRSPPLLSTLLSKSKTLRVPLRTHIHGLTITVELMLRGITLDRLTRYWPTRIAPDIRTWATASLLGGIVDQAHFTVTLISSPSSTGLLVKNLYGALTVRNATIDYISSMPQVRHTTAVVTIYKDRLEVRTNGGEIHGLHLTDGKVAITGLDQANQFCTITLTIAGSVSDALRLLDSKPIRYATAMMSPWLKQQTEGTAHIQLALAFPIGKNLTLEQVDAKAQIMVSGFSVAGLVLGHDITHGDLVITIDNERLHLEGEAYLAGVPVHLEWDEFFSSHRAAIRSRYKVHSYLDDAQRIALGLDLMPFIPPVLSGPTEIDIFVTTGFDGLGIATVEADLTKASVKFFGLGWHKPVSQSSKATAHIYFSTTTVYEIHSFIVQAGNEIILSGHATFTLTGQLDTITFDRIQAGRTELLGTLTTTQTGGLILRLTGPAFDLEPLLRPGNNDMSLYTIFNVSRNGSKYEDPMFKQTTNLAIELAVNRLWGSRDGFLTDVILTARQEDGLWRSGNLEASSIAKATNVAKNKRRGLIKATFTLLPALHEGRDSLTYISLTADEDAGAILRVFDLFDNIVGGKMQIDATIEGTSILYGTVRVKNYRLVNAPLLARLLTMATLTGILEMLTGDGIHFTSLNMPFVYRNGILSITDFRTSGPSLGLTATGKLFMHERLLEIDGTIIPIYFVNSLLSNIPFLGDILTGEKGGGLFAASYTINGVFMDPIITVNPLTVVTPGFLRNLFKLFKKR